VTTNELRKEENDEHEEECRCNDTVGVGEEGSRENVENAQLGGVRYKEVGAASSRVVNIILAANEAFFSGFFFFFLFVVLA